MKVRVIEFSKTYPNINTELSEAKFKLAIIAIYESELSRGFIVKKIYKTYKKGTNVTYKACESEEEMREYKEKVNLLVKDFTKNHFEDFIKELEKEKVKG